MNQLALKALIKARVTAAMALQQGTPKITPTIGDDGRVTTEVSPDFVKLVDANGIPTAVDPSVLDAIADGVSQAVVEFLRTVQVIGTATVVGIMPGPASATGVARGTIQ